jgi:hypothetical protein
MAMPGYRIELATLDDDADLRRILAETPMPGHLSVSFRREPSYFAAAEVDGHFRQVVAGRDLDTGRLIGFGSRSIRWVHVNGQPAAVGYLSALRLLAAHRNLGLVARGYAFFRKLHEDGQAPIYLTTIVEGNDRAIEILSSGRAGLPAYHPKGRYHTLAIPRAPMASRRDWRGCAIRQATVADLPAIMAFLSANGPARQFFPCYQAGDFFGAHGALKGLLPSDLLLAWRDERIVGTLGAWDQRDFRQAVVHGYEGLLRWGRPLYNSWAWLRGRPSLPRVGEVLRNRYAVLPVVENNDAGVFTALLESLPMPGSDYLLLGLHERDPLMPLARRYAAAEYVTRVFVVCWHDGEAYRGQLDGRLPYLEAGSL